MDNNSSKFQKLISHSKKQENCGKLFDKIKKQFAHKWLVCKEKSASENKPDYIEFDIAPTAKDVIGSCKKLFVRVRGKVLSELYDDLCKCDNYVTCVSPWFQGSPEISKKDFDDMYFSAILKSRDDRWSLASYEIIASRLCQLLGCKTSYITRYKKDEPMYICLDFLQKKEVYEDLNTYLTYRETVCEHSLKNFAKLIQLALYRAIPNSYPNKKEIIKQILEDFAYHWVVRVILLKDADYFTHNIGFVHDDGDYNYKLAPAFDFEFACCIFESLKESFADEYARDLDYLAENMPNVLQNIIKGINKPSANTIQETINKHYNDTTQTMYGKPEYLSEYILETRKYINKTYSKNARQENIQQR